MQSKDWICPVLFASILATLMFGLEPAPAQSGDPEPPSKQESEESESESSPAAEQQPQENDNEEPEQQDTEDGSKLLDQAFDLKLGAQTTKDLDQVANLCEQAIEKGLDPKATLQARKLGSGAMLEFANNLSQRIFQSGGRDRRWQLYRSQAIPRLERAIKFDENLVDAHILLAKLEALPGGNRPNAVAAIEKAIELAVDDRTQLSEALFIRASLAEEDSVRLADLNQAIKINPENAEALQVRANYYIQTGQPKEALEDYRAWLKNQPDNFQARILVANNLIATGDQFDESLQQAALELVEEAIKIKPDFTLSHTIKAQIYIIAEDAEQAIAAADRAIELEPKNVQALQLRGTALADQGDYEKALADADSIIRLQGFSPQGLQLRGIIRIRQGKFEKAIEDFEVLSQANPGSRAIRQQLAALYDANFQPDEAIKIYNSMLSDVDEDQWKSRPSEIKVELMRQRAELLRGRGDARLSSGEHKQAIQDYNQSLVLGEQIRKIEGDLGVEVSPPDDGVLNNLAWVLATTPDDKLRDGERAIQLATEAAEVTEFEQAYILSTLASGYAETGDFKTAIQWIEKALEVNRQVAEKAADKTRTDEQFESLNAELESYRNEQPWREKKDPAEERKKAAEAESSKPDAKQPEGEANDDQPDSESDPDSGSESESKDGQ